MSRDTPHVVSAKRSVPSRVDAAVGPVGDTSGGNATGGVEDESKEPNKEDSTPKEDEEMPLESKIWEFAPKNEKEQVQVESLEVSRSRTWWESIGVMTVHCVPVWPE